MSDCTLCPLSNCAEHNHTEGWGNPEAPLAIFLDHPGYEMAERFMSWLMMKLTLTSDDVFVDYTFKCSDDAPGKSPIGNKKPRLLHHKTCSRWKRPGLKAKSIVVSGEYSCELLGGVKMKDYVNRIAPNGMYCTYSFGAALFDASQAVGMWRIIFVAAKAAGLDPKYNKAVENFKFPPKKA